MGLGMCTCDEKISFLSFLNRNIVDYKRHIRVFPVNNVFYKNFLLSLKNDIEREIKFLGD